MFSLMPRPILLRYGCALLSVALAVVIRSLLEPVIEGQAPFLLFTLAVMTSAWFGGLGAGLLATGLGAFLGAYFFTEAGAPRTVSDTSDRVVLLLFMSIGVMISLFSQALHSSRERVEKTASELRISEDRYRRIVETANDGIWMVDGDGRTIFVNRHLTEMLGYSREEMLGKSSFDFIFGEDLPGAKQRFEERKQGTGEPQDLRFRRKDGAEVWTRVAASAVFDDSGAFAGVLGMCRDVTDRRRAEEERGQLLVSEQAARAEAEAANQAKDEFIATVSHELRTPLASMLMWTRMLGKGNLDEETTAQAHESLVTNIKMLAGLIDDLLDVSRIVAAKLRVEPQPAQFVPIIEAAVSVVRPAAEAKRIEIKQTLDSSEHIALADANRLQQVICNLLSNAIKFTPEGGRVEVRLEYVDTHAHIVVTDTGIGIRADLLPRIFERFYQIKEENERRGLGLGLAIVRHIIEMHGGTIEAASEGEGHGSIFTVRLPLMAAEPEINGKAQIVTALSVSDSTHHG